MKTLSFGERRAQTVRAPACSLRFITPVTLRRKWTVRIWTWAAVCLRLKPAQSKHRWGAVQSPSRRIGSSPRRSAPIGSDARTSFQRNWRFWNSRQRKLDPVARNFKNSKSRGFEIRAWFTPVVVFLTHPLRLCPKAIESNLGPSNLAVIIYKVFGRFHSETVNQILRIFLLPSLI